MKQIVVIVVLLALIAGGGFGGAGLMGIGPLAQLAKAEAKPVDAPKEPKLQAVDLETFGVPLIEGNSVRSRLFVNFSLNVDPEIGPHVTAHLPRVQSAVLQDLMAYLPRHLEQRQKPDPEFVQQRVLNVSRKVTGQQAIREVVIKAMFER